MRQMRSSFIIIFSLILLLGIGGPLYGDTDNRALQKNDEEAEKEGDTYAEISEEMSEESDREKTILDPFEGWNRAMFHVNDRLYFWLLKPVASVYGVVVNEDLRGLFNNFYENLKGPVRIVNNLLQGRVVSGGIEFIRFIINSTIGVGGLRDCAKECFSIDKREADFGQTLGKYGLGFGFYIVWPFIGPSSPRDTLGLVGDSLLMPQGYIDKGVMTTKKAGIIAHEKINYLSFHIGDYETLKKAAIDPYIAMRDAYVQYRREAVERKGD